MKKIINLTEVDLIRLVKRVLNEEMIKDVKVGDIISGTANSGGNRPIEVEFKVIKTVPQGIVGSLTKWGFDSNWGTKVGDTVRVRNFNGKLNSGASCLLEIPGSQIKDVKLTDCEKVTSNSSPQGSSTISKDYLVFVSGGGMSKVIPIMVKKGTSIKKKQSGNVMVQAFEGPLTSRPEVGGKIPPTSQFKPLVGIEFIQDGNYLKVIKMNNNSILDVEREIERSPQSEQLKMELRKNK